MSAEGLTPRELIELLKEDYTTHDRDWKQPGLWAIALHRVGVWAVGRKPGALHDRARALHASLTRPAGSLLGISLKLETKVGRRVRIWHHGCTRIAAQSIGDDVHLRQNTIVGPREPGNADPSSWPKLGNKVDVGSGACIQGEVEIGDEALVGANSLVLISAPPRTTVVGVPARVLPRMGKPRAAATHESWSQGSRDQNPTDIPLRGLLAEDFRVHGGRLMAPGFWAVAVHRFGNWRMSVRQRPLRAPLSLAYRAAFEVVRQVCGIDLPYDIKLGRRVRIVHHGSIHIGARSIGNDVVIRHAASIGVVRAGQDDPKPIIGDRVEIGPRACIVGSVTIGDDSIVGANTVVPIDLPPRSVALGVPARLVNLARITNARPPTDPTVTKAANS